VDTGVIIRGGEWNHVAIVLNASGKPTIYVNGISRYSDTGTNPNVPTNANAIGAYVTPAGGFFNGRVDGVAFYNAALSATQIYNHYKAGDAFFNGKRLTTKPRFVSSVRRGPLAQGLIVASLMGRGAISMAGSSRVNLPRNLIDQQFASMGGPSGACPDWGNGLYGDETVYTQAGAIGDMIFSHVSINQNFCTIEMWASFTDWQNTVGGILAMISSLFTNVPAGGSINVRFGDNTVGNPQDCLVGLKSMRPRLGGTHQIVLVSNAGGISYYMDGALIGTGSALPSFAFTQIRIGRDDSGNSRSPYCQIHMFNMWNRDLSAAEVSRRWADPWDLYDDEHYPLIWRPPSPIIGRVERRPKMKIPPREPRPAFQW
jgi:hypothetical protein